MPNHLYLLTPTMNNAAPLLYRTLDHLLTVANGWYGAGPTGGYLTDHIAVTVIQRGGKVIVHIGSKPYYVQMVEVVE